LFRHHLTRAVYDRVVSTEGKIRIIPERHCWVL